MTKTAENVYTVTGTDLTSGEAYLVPKDLPDTNEEADQYSPHQADENHRAWMVKLVAGPSTVCSIRAGTSSIPVSRPDGIKNSPLGGARPELF